MKIHIQNLKTGKNKHQEQQARADPFWKVFLRTHQNSVKIFLVFCALGLLMQTKELNHNKINENQTLQRQDPGSGEIIQEMELSIPEMEEETEYTLTVPEQLLSKADQRALFEKAEKEIDETFPGDNRSVDEIITPVVLKKQLAEGLISVEWRLDDMDIMNSDGTINREAIPEEGAVVNATAVMTYGELERRYEFPFHVYPKPLTRREAVFRDISDQLSKEGERAGTTDLALPTEALGMKLFWSEKKDNTGMIFMALGILAAVLVEFSGKQKENDRKKARDQELMRDYPEMVNKLSLLLGAGMTVSAAWERIIGLYERQKKDGLLKERPTYEEMKLTFREMKEGVGERTAYERFGERCGLRPYRKLSSLIVQNLRKGSRGLTGLMEAEADEAFELRKNLAKKLGEEAGTKLLAPMLMMLGIVVVIIMVPAFLSFGMK